jgi:hypothetical protein
MSKKTIKSQIENELFSMELNDELDINDLIIKIWGHNDFFVRRSFDVYLCKAKAQYPVRQFKVVKNNLVRIK